ncbi:MAG: Glu/Leu/Phe/Val dehydrogenase [Deltaproteobacteria bacterium]|nr:Glu/Leu/Phe/Val dehydrogenase [Deltaproteobacteria bacterium]
MSAIDYATLAAELVPAELHVLERPALGLTAVIAIDDLRLGPACGGIRWRAYPTPEEGVRDVLRLARAMSHKNALAELAYGGGKAVVLKDPVARGFDPAAAFPLLGELIEALGGRYVTACDYGTTAAELALVTSRTRHVLAEDAPGGLDLATATGVVAAMRAIWRRVAGADRLGGARVLVQGVGDVGLALVRLLVGEGAEVAFAEIDEDRAELCSVETGAARVDARRIFERPVDLFAPCAAGEVVTEEVARTIAARGIAGAANNQLATPAAGRVLHARGVWYAPDFAVNAGAVIAGYECGAGRGAHALDVVRCIEARIARVFAAAAARSVPPHEAALALARERLDAAGPGAARTVIASH